MRRRLCLILAVLCLLLLCACGENYKPVSYSANGLYPKDDIKLSILETDQSRHVVKLRVENQSEHTLYYGRPFFSFARQSSAGGWECLDAEYDVTAELYSLDPGESFEKAVNVGYYLENLKRGTYRASFAFFIKEDNPEADGVNFQPIITHYYLTRDFIVG